MIKPSCLLIAVLAIGISHFSIAAPTQSKGSAETRKQIEQFRQQLQDQLTKEYQEFKRDVIVRAKNDLLKFTQNLPPETKQDIQTWKQLIEQMK
jgi:hypothetical protein